VSAYRVADVAQELLRRGWTKAELAERLGVSERTIKRDLAALQRAGWPVRCADDSSDRVLPRMYWIDRGAL
jgi:predicted DNA-binding transcriptional regulator YafY